jgi:hypothetical protein
LTSVGASAPAENTHIFLEDYKYRPTFNDLENCESSRELVEIITSHNNMITDFRSSKTLTSIDSAPKTLSNGGPTFQD